MSSIKTTSILATAMLLAGSASLSEMPTRYGRRDFDNPAPEGPNENKGPSKRRNKRKAQKAARRKNR